MLKGQFYGMQHLWTVYQWMIWQETEWMDSMVEGEE
jgi:hypothetical protein